MTKIAIISDIHGNLPALNKVFDDIDKRDIKKIICLGDIAGKGPSSAECFDLVVEKCESIVKGNWDYFMCEKESEMLKWHQKKLGAQRLSVLNKLPLYLEFYMSGKLVRLCHASPHDIFHRTHIHTEKKERMKLFEKTKTLSFESDVVGYGDIHGAYVDFFNGKTIFNTGSVGNPLEITQASYAIMEGTEGSQIESPISISIVRLPYDIQLATKQAMDSNMPDKEEYIKELKTAIYRGRKKL